MLRQSRGATLAPSWPLLPATPEGVAWRATVLGWALLQQLCRTMATASRRVAKELDEIRRSGFRCFQNIEVDEINVRFWKGLLVPDEPPYNKGAFWIEISFPCEYPLRPPKIRFKTKIYHPNVDEEGHVCLPIISDENWKPATKITHVIQDLIMLVNKPEPAYPLRADLAEEFDKDKKRFLSKAEDHTCTFSEKRP